MSKPNYGMQIIPPAQFAGTAADEVIAALLELESESKGKKLSLALAGGGTPVGVYKSLTVAPRSTAFDWSKVNFFYGDERWVSHEDPQSNYKMSYESFLNPLHIPAGQIFKVDTSLATPAEGAAKYEAVLREYTGNTGTLDLVLLGMGDDGHTASLFPESPLLQESDDKLVASAIHPETKQPRVSLTVKAILQAKKIIVFIAGAAKADILSHVLSGQRPHFPIQLLEPVAEKVTFVVDTLAAKQ